MFTSNCTTSTLPVFHAMNAFNIDDMELINIKSEPWGVMVEILTGENAGIYDFHFDSKTFIAA